MSFPGRDITLSDEKIERLILGTVQLAIDGCHCRQRRCIHTKIVDMFKKAFGRVL